MASLSNFSGLSKGLTDIAAQVAVQVAPVVASKVTSTITDIVNDPASIGRTISRGAKDIFDTFTNLINEEDSPITQAQADVFAPALQHGQKLLYALTGDMMVPPVMVKYRDVSSFAKTLLGALQQASRSGIIGDVLTASRRLQQDRITNAPVDQASLDTVTQFAGAIAEVNAGPLFKGAALRSNVFAPPESTPVNRSLAYGVTSVTVPEAKRLLVALMSPPLLCGDSAATFNMILWKLGVGNLANQGVQSASDFQTWETAAYSQVSTIVPGCTISFLGRTLGVSAGSTGFNVTYPAATPSAAMVYTGAGLNPQSDWPSTGTPNPAPIVVPVNVRNAPGAVMVPMSFSPAFGATTAVFPYNYEVYVPMAAIVSGDNSYMTRRDVSVTAATFDIWLAQTTSTTMAALPFGTSNSPVSYSVVFGYMSSPTGSFTAVTGPINPHCTAASVSTAMYLNWACTISFSLPADAFPAYLIIMFSTPGSLTSAGTATKQCIVTTSLDHLAVGRPSFYDSNESKFREADAGMSTLACMADMVPSALAYPYGTVYSYCNSLVVAHGLAIPTLCAIVALRHPELGVLPDDNLYALARKLDNLAVPVMKHLIASIHDDEAILRSSPDVFSSATSSLSR